MIVLVGFMGAGKTTVGALLAQRLGLAFTDTDHVVAARAGRSVAEVFATDGEEAFRDLEATAVADVLAGPAAVVSLGGGACGRPATRALLRAHDTVHLDVPLATALARTGRGADRPVLARPDLPQLHAARREVFLDVARWSVPVQGRTAAQVADAVVALLPAA